ncbi:MAG: hypothetical protein N3A69_12560, partial [Leptospiraceae bacterium]|nr:hypothetical protein [Leptospiraceae bacterium]
MTEITKKKVFEWREIELASPEALTIAKIPIFEPNYKNAKNLSLSELKSKLESLLSPDLKTSGFVPESALYSDLLGNIRLKAGSFATSLYPNLIASPEVETSVLELV